MKIILFGSTGQIGSHLKEKLSRSNNLICVGRNEANFENYETLYKIITEHTPDVIINAAAYTNVDKAESEPDVVYNINCKAQEVMAKAAKDINALLVSYSTDYIFDGTKDAPYTEQDLPNPLSIYGNSKLLGEKAIINSGCKYIIFRTSWVYSLHGINFINKIIKLAKENDSLKIVDDQIGAPTSADFVAEVTYKCISDEDINSKLGIYNLTSCGSVSWYELTKYVLSKIKGSGNNSNCNINNIYAISSTQLALPAKRPKNSILNTNLLKSKFRIDIEDWKYYLDQLIKQIIQDKK